jgi:8-oxo-dGTP pyrophosphatase MutT (NUDIX family)
MKKMIRPVALCVFLHADRLLVVEYVHPADGRCYYRPPGGTIEYGEHSRAAAVRELREELGAEIHRLRLLGTLENIYTFEGRVGHELVQVYQAEFVDPAYYARPQFSGRETTRQGAAGAEGHKSIQLKWLPLAQFVAAPDSGPPPAAGNLLVPGGLLALLPAPPRERKDPCVDVLP